MFVHCGKNKCWCSQWPGHPCVISEGLKVEVMNTSNTTDVSCCIHLVINSLKCCDHYCKNCDCLPELSNILCLMGSANDIRWPLENNTCCCVDVTVTIWGKWQLNLDSIMIIDETWFLYFTRENLSILWHHPWSLSKPPKFKQMLSTCKLIATDLWDDYRNLLCEFIPSDESINTYYYGSMLKKL